MYSVMVNIWGAECLQSMSKYILIMGLLLSINITGYIMDHFDGKHNHTSPSSSIYGLIDLNDSGNNTFTNTSGTTEVIHLSDIQEDEIAEESGDN